ncbi:MAG TPA: type II toxin-antitoxin system prevent-host-death family antitoxin [Candidatus Polarisedimenticolia bacterium]|nr:type II toxin-antitoxin system prevent-host-death family antitoxin [Candidatus Polarisedimenticolia bacterium]
MSVTDARRNFSKLLDRVERGERIVVTRYGRHFVAVIPVSDFQLLRFADVFIFTSNELLLRSP